MKCPPVALRRATLEDAETAAAIARQSRGHFLPYLPDLQAVEEDMAFYRKSVFPACEVWVAEENDELVGFCAFRKGWVEHLYLLPGYVGRSIGEALLQQAKARHGVLRLWVFQRNLRAISFYRRNGFRMIRETDGCSNEERTPDALFEWRRSARRA